MPLPNDEKVVALANDLIAVFDNMFGVHPGFRPAHAKGVLLNGTFTPSAVAATITKAEHMSRSLPVFVRFSNSTGLPSIPDNDPNANPRGMAIRFYTAERRHTDIVAHSIDAFPTRTGEEFLEFLHAAMASAPGTPSPTPVEKFIAGHPATEIFVKTPKPAPASFANETFFGVLAFKFTNAQGVERYGRYRIVPEAGSKHLSDDEVKSKDADFLMHEIIQSIKKQPVRFKLMLQIAQGGDEHDDSTVRWPNDREVIELGTIELTDQVEDNAAQQQQIIFDPIPRIDGLEATADPLFELRAAVYLISGRRRRAAEAHKEMEPSRS
ncbi:MAG TPA: catalase family peroxidase [Trichormus sp.]|jgi:catalase